ncbi:MAG: preprotein translocase subunit SecG [Alphaproteobacteria bacterium]|nr:preprotein translocase subunit SecG [Alphaproteobacteria bacterium]MCB9696145.1 preprotein translocase subunit SecG [Alphaproteobacteria bacterium]
MYPFFVALHILLSLFLITVVLLQPGKGGDVGAAFGGGGGSTIFGPRGPTNVLQQATTVTAVLFMVTSITLAIYSNRTMLADADVEGELQRLQQDVPHDETPAELPPGDPASVGEQ